MNDLKRELAPITDRGWEEIETEAKRTLATSLAGRKLVDFRGPLGWSASAISSGRVDPLETGPVRGVEARLRAVQPLLELRMSFELERQELDAIDRGAADADLGPLTEAARSIAAAEDRLIFDGFGPAATAGIVSGSAHKPIPLSEDYASYPETVARASERLRENGIGGPYAIALGPRCFTGLAETAGPGGYPVIRHVQRLLDGPVVWAPSLEGAVLLSLRGGDFELHVGRDLAIGYHEHDRTRVRLYLEESVAFRLHTPEAAVPLRPALAAS